MHNATPEQFREYMGQDATAEDAASFIEYLNERGYEVVQSGHRVDVVDSFDCVPMCDPMFMYHLNNWAHECNLAAQEKETEESKCGLSDDTTIYDGRRLDE